MGKQFIRPEDFLGCFDGVKELELALEKVKDPEWEKTNRVHDWRNYVPELFKNAWASIDNITRLFIYVVCQEFANREEWD